MIVCRFILFKSQFLSDVLPLHQWCKQDHFLHDEEHGYGVVYILTSLSF